MTDAIVKASDFTREEIELIKTQICKGASDAQLALFKATCDRLGLDPFARQIFGVMRENRKAGTTDMTIQVSIDGFRAVAEASGDYQGQTPTQWCGDDGVWRDVWLSNDYPAAARVGVWRDGFRDPLYAVATWASYVQTKFDGKPSDMWNRMPDVMLAKCAESLALRKAFPRKLSGLYTPDEMGQADNRPTAMIGGAHVAEVIPQEQTYTNPVLADEKASAQARAQAYVDSVAPDLREAHAAAVEEMLAAQEEFGSDAAELDREQQAITTAHRQLLREWCHAQREPIVAAFNHPAASNARAKLWRLIKAWADAAHIDADEVKSWLSTEARAA